ncbi:MAG: PRC and DUF2382 domain-containing protein [Humibacillus sp.]|nr:PRC and DUF2382 domain-containing protein [Humibacillus sp.]MDN5775736.1 PRC and DUF2382 domain-containing protein [Humibacillus sp.]
MINSNEVAQIDGRAVYGSDNDKIGKAGQVYLDDESGQPEWVTVNTGLFGTNESFVPLREASLTEDGVTVPYSKDKVKDAPNVDPDAGHITPDEEQHLYEYYGLTQVSAAVGNVADRDGDRADADLRDADQPYDQNTARSDDGRDHAAERGEGHDTSGPNTDAAMTRSEEQLKVGTTTREAGKARLRKYVVTEEQTVTVPVTREEVRLEREPITDANVGEATAGAEISEEEHEVTLHEEQVVVQKEAVPVERVKLGTETVTEEKQVTEEVRKEQFDTDGLEQSTDRADADTTRR